MARSVPITLDTLCLGAVQERFDRELEAVVRNIRDPNCAADGGAWRGGTLHKIGEFLRGKIINNVPVLA